jgi:hypothetical protein
MSIVTATRVLHIINTQLEQIHSQSHAHYISFLYYRRILLWTTIIVNVSNAISVTSLAIYFAGTHTVLMLCLISSSMSTILSIIVTAWGVEDKVHSHQITYLQLQDLTSTYVPAVVHQWRDPVLIQRLLETLNYKTTIIMNTSHPTRTPLIMCPTTPIAVLDAEKGYTRER